GLARDLKVAGRVTAEREPGDREHRKNCGKRGGALHCAAPTTERTTGTAPAVTLAAPRMYENPPTRKAVPPARKARAIIASARLGRAGSRNRTRLAMRSIAPTEYTTAWTPNAFFASGTWVSRSSKATRPMAASDR